MNLFQSIAKDVKNVATATVMVTGYVAKDVAIASGATAKAASQHGAVLALHGAKATVIGARWVEQKAIASQEVACKRGMALATWFAENAR